MYLAQALYYIPIFPNCILFPAIQPICVFENQSNFLPFHHWEPDATATTQEVPKYIHHDNIHRTKRYPPNYNHTRWGLVKKSCIESTWNQERVVQRIPSYIGLTAPYYNGGLAYVLDTYIDISHRNFGGRVYRGPDFDYGNVSGHGTHVAGLIISNSFGMARNGIVIGVQVMNGDGSGQYSNILKGLSWAWQDWQSRGKPHAVINLSIGGPYSALLNNAVESIRNAGLHVVVAAGNNGEDACKYSPASANVITVGATDRDDNFAEFSNRGHCVTILAPGVSIQSLYPDQLQAIMSGTSMAAPIVSGILLNYPPQPPLTMEVTLLKAATKLSKIPLSTVSLLVYDEAAMMCSTFKIQ
jgi:cerevisin